MHPSMVGGSLQPSENKWKWSAAEKLLHINILQLKGVFLALQALLGNKSSITVSLTIWTIPWLWPTSTTKVGHILLT
jgi:hypothetical protein